MSDIWYSASEGESDSEKEEKRGWIQERARSMGRGRGSTKPSDRPAEVERDLPRAYVGESKPLVWDNPFELAGIGRGVRVSSAEVMRQATASYSRLVREEAVRELPVTEVSVVATNDSRPVREEAVESYVGDSGVSVVASKEPVVFRGRSRSREARHVATSGVACISRPSGDVEFPPGRKDFRDSICPVPGCGF